jgi:hypothetical protein
MTCSTLYNLCDSHTDPLNVYMSVCKVTNVNICASEIRVSELSPQLHVQILTQVRYVHSHKCESLVCHWLGHISLTWIFLVIFHVVVLLK